MKILADSSANLISSADGKIVSVPLTIRTDAKEFVDNAALDVKEMIDHLASYKGKSGTACPSSQDWYDSFGDEDEVFAFAIASVLSGSFNSLRVAKEQYEEDYPGRKVFAFDSITTGPEMKLMVEKTQELYEAGFSFEEICEKITEYQKTTNLTFMLKSLTNLANNGRVSQAAAKIAGVLNIVVVGISAESGEIEQKEKARGEKKAILTLKKTIDEMGYKGGKVRIDHCFNEPAANKVKELIQAEYPNADIQIGTNRGLCSFYAEAGGLLIGFEC